VLHDSCGFHNDEATNDSKSFELLQTLGDFLRLVVSGSLGEILFGETAYLGDPAAKSSGLCRRFLRSSYLRYIHAPWVGWLKRCMVDCISCAGTFSALY
jgi:hypothetical protein